MSHVMQTVGSLLNHTENKTHCHPGLWLDKFTTPGEQERTKEDLNRVIQLNQTAGSDPDSNAFLQGYGKISSLPDTVSFTAKTASPMAVHLARAGALENAGICLHRTYGFPYLPGSGIKGLAHAFACEIWLPAEAKKIDDNVELDTETRRQKKKDLWEKIMRVFGGAPSPWFNDLIQRSEAFLGALLPGDKAA